MVKHVMCVIPRGAKARLDVYGPDCIYSLRREAIQHTGVTEALSELKGLVTTRAFWNHVLGKRSQ